MGSPQFGVVLDQENGLRPARSDDPVSIVVLRSCFLNPPRAASARKLAGRIKQIHSNAEIIPYAWHYLTHERTDGIQSRGSRSIPGSSSGFGHLKETPEAKHAWSVTMTCAEAFSSRKILIHTPASFSPSSVYRKRLLEFTAAHDNFKFVWQPSGLWTAAEAAYFTKDSEIEVLGPAPSPSEHPAHEKGSHWILIPGAKDARFSGTQAEILADSLIESKNSPTILFSGPKAYSNLRTFKREWNQL